MRAQWSSTGAKQSTHGKLTGSKRSSKRRDGGMPNDVYVYMKLKTLTAVQLLGYKSAEGDR